MMKRSLQSIADEIGICTKCQLHATRHTTVPGAGSPQAAIVLVGEAPGAQEDLQGLPFVGRSGTLLTHVLEEVGLTREEVFITSILKCRPPNNRNPLQPEIKACYPFLQAQLQAIQPRIICTLGSPATNTLLGTKYSMGKVRGHWFAYEGIRLMPTFHPAYILRSPSKRVEALQDWREIMRAHSQMQ